MAARDPVRRTERVRAAIEAAIIEHRYPPGTRLVEDDLARELGVSRTPVREAFRSLEDARWIEVRPHAGAHVRMPRIDEARQDFELRHELQGFAARLAATRMTAAQDAALQEVVAAGFDASERGDQASLLELNDRFYALLTEAAHNERLRAVLTDLAKRIKWYFHHLVDQRDGDQWDEHRAIIESVRSGDAALAERMLREHSQHSEEEFLNRVLGVSTPMTFGPAPAPSTTPSTAKRAASRPSGRR